MLNRIRLFFLNNREFVDISNEKRELVKVTKKNLNNGSVVKIYNHLNTLVVYSDNGTEEHASISNPNRKVKKWEIYSVISQIMKEEKEGMNVNTSHTGVVHINPKKI